MHAAGITHATDDWIRSSMHREGSTVDTAKAFGILPPGGAPARFAGGPLDGTTMPSELEPGAGQVPRLEYVGGAYELMDIDYQAGEYLFAWLDAKPRWVMSP